MLILFLLILLLLKPSLESPFLLQCHIFHHHHLHLWLLWPPLLLFSSIFFSLHSLLLFLLPPIRPHVKSLLKPLKLSLKSADISRNRHLHYSFLSIEPCPPPLLSPDINLIELIIIITSSSCTRRRNRKYKVYFEPPQLSKCLKFNNQCFLLLCLRHVSFLIYFRIPSSPFSSSMTPFSSFRWRNRKSQLTKCTLSPRCYRLFSLLHPLLRFTL